MSTDKPRSIVIELDELGQELVCGNADKCVDFQTGAIVRLADCPERDSGEGRPALRRGKRLIRIPTLDEACDEATVDPGDPRMEKMLEDWCKGARLRQIEELEKLETADPNLRGTAARHRQLDDLLDELAADGRAVEGL